MKKVEIIKMVANHYDNSNRGVGEFGCVYFNSNTGNKCAVGMCMTNEALDEFGEFDDSAHGLNEHIVEQGREFDLMLKPEFRGHAVDFWDLLQNFHDTNDNWCYRGLTDEGRKNLDYLIEKFEDK